MLEIKKADRDKIKKEFNNKCAEYFLKKSRERVYDVVSIASSMA